MLKHHSSGLCITFEWCFSVVVCEKKKTHLVFLVYPSVTLTFGFDFEHIWFWRLYGIIILFMSPKISDIITHLVTSVADICLIEIFRIVVQR